MMERWSSRKLGVATLWQIMFTVMLWHGKLTPQLYYDLSLITIGGYLAANVIQKFSAQKP